MVLQLPWVATHLPVKERCGQEPAVPERRGQTPPSGTRTGEAALLGSGSHGMDGQTDGRMDELTVTAKARPAQQLKYQTHFNEFPIFVPRRN